MVNSVECSSIADEVDAMRRGDTSPRDGVLSVRRRIDAYEPRLRAWVALAHDLDQQVRAQTDIRPAAPLLGISVGVKDLIDVAGLPTLAGSVTMPTGPRSIDADCVRRLRDLGAIVQGKTVTTEFGYFDPGPTRNPNSPKHTPGGSSSGSSAAVGAGVLPVALGTQTAGSLTRPASFCGAAGLVLTRGSTSLSGVTGLSESLDSLGLLTRTTADLAYVFRAFSGDSVSPPSPVSRTLFWNGSGLGDLDPSMSALLRHARRLVADIGLAVGDLDWDDHVRTLADDHVTVMAHEAARTLRRLDTFDRHRVSAPLNALVATGDDITQDQRDSALARRDFSAALFRELLGSDTVVVGPAAVGPAPAGLDSTGSPVLSRPWQLLGLPAVAVPGARTAEGLPLGLQILGHPGSEATLLDVAEKLEPLLRDLPPVLDGERELRR